MSSINPDSKNSLSLEGLVEKLEKKGRLTKNQQGDILGLIKSLDYKDVKEMHSLRKRVQAVLKAEEKHDSGKLLGPVADKVSASLNKVRLGSNLSRKEIAQEFLRDNCFKECKADQEGKLAEALSKLGCEPAEYKSIQELFSHDTEWQRTSEGSDTKYHGIVIHYDRASQNITLLQGDKRVDVDTGIITYNPDSERISFQEAEAIHQFILQNKEPLMQLAKKNGESIYLSSKETGLARSLHFTEEGKVFAHLNKKTVSPHRSIVDILLGRGSFKKVTIAVDLSTGKRFASASMSMDEAKKEKESLASFKGMDNFSQALEMFSYRSKKSGRMKSRVLFPIADRGSLSDALEKGLLTGEEKKVVFQQLLKAVAIMHKEGILHRDFKTDNLLLHGKGEDIKVILADFGSSVEENDTLHKRYQVGTVRFQSPEYAKLDPLDRDAILEKTTYANDIWALGVTLDEIFHGERKFAPAKGGNDAESKKHILAYEEKEEPEDKSSIDHAIWSMLLLDPKKRPSASQLVERYGEVI